MIRTETEYQEALRRLEQGHLVAEKQRVALHAAGLPPEAVDRAMEPLLSFQAQFAEEIEWYRGAREGRIPAIRDLTQLGRLLIALRIAHGVGQRELAERMGVSEAVVSRDERNEYHGVTVTRAQKIIDALQGVIAATVEEAPRQRELQPVGKP